MSFRKRLQRFGSEVKDKTLQAIKSSNDAVVSPVTDTTSAPLHSGIRVEPTTGVQILATSIDPILDPSSELAPATSMDTLTPSWRCLHDFRRALSRASGGLGPLRSVISGLSECISVYEHAANSRRDYAILKNELEALFNILSEKLSNTGPPTMTAGMENLCTAIEAELDRISRKEDQGIKRRYLEANKDLDDVIECYRRIQGHLERLKLNVDLSMWKIVDELSAENRLKSLLASNAARYNSAESLQIGRRECTPETRKQFLAGLNDWSHDKDQDNMYWLSGMAGTGKTTIASSLCAMLDKSHELGASFFCSRLLPECRKVNLILPTIAYQLARFSRPYYHALNLALQSDPDLHTKVLPTQLKGLIVGPLHEVAHALPANFVVVIDALDECEDAEGVGLLLEILAKCASILPFKLFVSSRPEPQIRQKLGDIKLQLILHELEDSIVAEDIKLYLETELKDLFSLVSDADLAALVKRSGVLFIYASTIVRYIRGATSAPLRRKRIQSVLGINSSGYSNRDNEINTLYTTILDSAFNSPKLEDAEKTVMRLVLDTVVCACEPLGIEAMASLLELEGADLVEAALEPLSSVLHTSGHNSVVTTLHASFPDYMLDTMRSKEHGCQAQNHHDRLAKLCFDRIKRNQPQFNICGLESSFMFDEDVQDLDHRLTQAIPQDLWYACYYWGTHMGLGEHSGERLEQLQDFLSERLLLWMEVLNLRQTMAFGPLILEHTRLWCKTRKVAQEIQDVVRDAWRFTTTFATSDVSRSTPHLYVSMLAIWQSQGLLADYYRQRTTALCRLTGTGMARRTLGLLSILNTGSSVYSVTFSPDGRRIVAGLYEEIWVWGVASGKLVIDPLEGHTREVTSVAFAPDGTRIASGSEDSTIRVWDSMTGRSVMEPFDGHPYYSATSVAFSPDGTRIVSGSHDAKVRVWDATSGKLVMDPLEGHPFKWVNSVAFSPDSMRIVSGWGDCTIRVWDSNNGKISLGPLTGHSRSVESVAFSPDGTLIGSGSSDRTVRLWDAGNGNSVMDPLEGHTSIVTSVSFSPGSTRVVSGSYDNTVRVWDVTSGKIVALLEGHTSYVQSVAFSPNGMHIVSGSNDCTVCVWDATSRGTVTHPLGGHDHEVHSVAFSPDGTHIISGSIDKTFCVWDANNGKLVMDKPKLSGHSDAVSSVAISPNGTLVVSGSEDGTIQMWDVLSGEPVLEALKGHTSSVLSVAFSPSGMHIVSGSQDNTVGLWNAVDGTLLFPPLQGHTDLIRTVAFSPNGTRVASGSDDKTIRVWNVISGQLVIDPLYGHTGVIFSVAFSPDNKCIASGAGDHTIRVWSAANGSLLVDPFWGHTEIVTSIAFSPDGRFIVSGSGDRTVCVWDASSGALMIDPLEGHISLVYSVAFSPKMHIISGSRDTTIRVWGVHRWLPEPGPLEPPTRAVDCSWTVDEDGWVLDEQGSLLLWLPKDLQDRVLRPQNTLLISRKGSVELGLDNIYVGELWVKCYTPA